MTDTVYIQQAVRGVLADPHAGITDAEEGEVTGFRISGRIGHHAVSATWTGGYLTADEELLDRAEALIERGMVVAVDGVDRYVVASLGVPLAAFLTLTRCFDEVKRSGITLRPVNRSELVTTAGGLQLNGLPAASTIS